MAETPRDAAGTGPARTDDLREQRRHSVPLGWTADSVSSYCRYGIDGCPADWCVCTCHDQRDREAVSAAFRRGLLDG